MKNFKPVAGRLLIQPIEYKPESKGGILLPATVVPDYPSAGTVIAVGDGSDIKVGETVYFHRWAGTKDIYVDGKPYMTLQQDEVLGRKVVDK